VARRATTTVRRELPPYREKEQEMRNKIRIIGVSLASMAGLLLVSGVAWAQANQTPVSGTVSNFVEIDPGKIWEDEAGVLHIRNERWRERYRGNIRGQQFKIQSWNIEIDPVTGRWRELDYHGSFTFVGLVFGETVKATGRFMGQCSDCWEPNNCEEIEIWHLDDGRKINLTEVWSWSGGPSVYEGILLDPPGRR
jgi:hypothetical protein